MLHRSTKKNGRSSANVSAILGTQVLADSLDISIGLEFANLKFSESCDLWRIALARGAHARRTRRWTTQQGDCHLKRSGEQRPPLPPREWSLRRDGESTRREELLPCLVVLSPSLERSAPACTRPVSMHILCAPWYVSLQLMSNHVIMREMIAKTWL